MAAGAGAGRELKLVSLIGVSGNAYFITIDESTRRPKLSVNEALIKFLIRIQGMEEEGEVAREEVIKIVHHLFTSKTLTETIKHLYYDFKAESEDLSHSLSLLRNLVEILEELFLAFVPPTVLHLYDAVKERDLGDTYSSNKYKRPVFIRKEWVRERLYSECENLEAGVISNPDLVDALMKALEEFEKSCTSDDMFAELDEMDEDMREAATEKYPGLKIFFDYRDKDKELLSQLRTEEKDKKDLLIKVFKHHGTENVLYLWTSTQREVYDAILADPVTKITTERGEELLSDVVKRCTVFIEQEGAIQRTLKDYCSIFYKAVEKMVAEGLLNEAFERILRERLSNEGLEITGDKASSRYDTTKTSEGEVRKFSKNATC